MNEDMRPCNLLDRETNKEKDATSETFSVLFSFFKKFACPRLTREGRKTIKKHAFCLPAEVVIGMRRRILLGWVSLSRLGCG